MWQHLTLAVLGLNQPAVKLWLKFKFGALAAVVVVPAAAVK
jgi:hypothetical protein